MMELNILTMRRIYLFLLILVGAGFYVLFHAIPTIRAMLNTAHCQPDKRIIYTSAREEILFFSYNQVEVICADGSGTVYHPVPGQLTDALDIVFSPDGKRLAYLSQHRIYVMNVDGSDLIQLTKIDEDEFGPTWSPNGQKLAFYKYLTDTTMIYVIDIACLATQLNCASTAVAIGPGLSPAWSPDGTRIAFAANEDEFHRNIYVMNADGSGRTRLTNADRETYANYPAWSPDGLIIAFSTSSTSCPCPNPDRIYLMNVDRSNVTYLTNGEQPIWSHDGKFIIFTSDRDGGGKRIGIADMSTPVNALYRITRDGKETIRLTHGNNDRLQAFSWMPR